MKEAILQKLAADGNMMIWGFVFVFSILQRSEDALQFAIFKEAILQKSEAGGNQMICWHPVITQSGSSQPCAVADIKTFKLWKEKYNFALVICNFQVCSACAGADTKTFKFSPFLVNSVSLMRSSALM